MSCTMTRWSTISLTRSKGVLDTAPHIHGVRLNGRSRRTRPAQDCARAVRRTACLIRNAQNRPVKQYDNACMRSCKCPKM